MGVLNDLRDAITAELTAAGVKVRTDPRGVPPFVSVEVPVRIRQEGRAGYTAEVNVMVVAPGPANENALRWQLDQVEAVMDCLRISEASQTNVEVSGTTCPAYAVIVTRTIARTVC